MTTAKRLVTATTGILLVVSIVFAQEQSTANSSSSSRSAATITAAASADHVRFTAPSSVVQIRLEVYNANGEKVFDNEIRGGNVIDWLLQNGQAERLSDGSYLCVITGKSLSGRISQRVGSVTVLDAVASLQPVDVTQLTARQSQAVGPLEDNASLTVLKEDENQTATVIAHNGTEGQITRGRGALSFRLGDFFSGKDTEQMRLTEEGNLGIGTSDPKVKLDVAGMIGAREGVMFSDGSTLSVNKKGVLTHNSAGGDVSINLAGTGTLNRLAKWTDNSGTLGNSGITETAGGFVGIGNANPESLLHVGPNSGYGTTNGLLIANNLTGSQFDRSFQISPRQTASPSSNSILIYALPTVNPGVTVPQQYGIFVDGRQGAGAIASYAAIATGQTASLGATNNTHLLLGTLANPLGNYAIFDSTGYKTFFSGNVGIGTTTPGAKLDVAGDIQVSGNAVIAGNIAAKYQDLAEWVPARQKLAAGTVVSLDLNRTNAVVPSARAYDTHIAGVVSLQPGVILGQDGPGKVLIATTGRVKVKVDATPHPIRIGDLLVTSNKSGLAMKSLPFRVAGNLIHRPGTIIGKALEPLAKGRGEILVLLSLQ